MINFFKDEYEGFSNFDPVVIYYMHYNYPTLEHAYVASKSFDGLFHHRISKVPADKAGLAKRMGREVKLRGDWEKVKVRLMERFLRQKFSYEKFRNLLLSTGDEILVEGNWWHDNYWGNCHCNKCKDIEGQNMLGRLLMKIREDLKKELEHNSNRRHSRTILTSE